MACRHRPGRVGGALPLNRRIATLGFEAKLRRSAGADPSPTWTARLDGGMTVPEPLCALYLSPGYRSRF